MPLHKPGPYRTAHLLLPLVLLLSTHTAGEIPDAATTPGITASAGSSTNLPVAAKPADLSGCPKLRIAVVNGVPYHYEVLAGLLYVLRPYARHTDVYLNQYVRKSTDGAWDILRRFRFTFLPLTRKLMSSITQNKLTYDLVVLVSPDYELEANAELLHHVQRRMTVAIVHNSDFNETQRLLDVAAGGGSSVQLVTLAQHTATSLAAAAGGPAEWILAVYPHKPKTNCLQASEVDLLGGCVRGFSIQGKFSNLRRNYSALWQQMLARQDAITSARLAPLFHVTLLGKGLESRLAVPPQLLPHVSLLKGLAFRGFYDAIHRTYALLPLFGSPKYLADKFSSTVLTSLIAGTPLIADQRFLASYTMFGSDSVYLQLDGEEEMDVMLRVLRMQAPEMLAVRRALLGVRRGVNARATEFYARLLAGLCGSSSSNSSSSSGGGG